jgi:hypothetical protein
MAILGVLSLFQLTLLPGLIFTKLVKLQGVGITVIFSLAVSPILNYLLVFSLTVLKIYDRELILGLFCLEIILSIYLFFPFLGRELADFTIFQHIKSFYREYTNSEGSFSRIIFGVVFFLALFCLFVYILLYAFPNGSIFSAWDPVVSWDRWAVDWYHNRLPESTWHYPQLIPANWSLSYQFIGDSSLKFFAKEYMEYYEIYILLAIFTLGVIKRQGRYFVGVVVAAWLQFVLGSRGTGYVDSAVSFFALMVIISLFLFQEDPKKNGSIYIYYGAIFAAGAAVVKQAGLLIMLSYPALLFFSVDGKYRRWILPYIPRVLWIYLVVAVPWYVYKEYHIKMGGDNNEIAIVTSIVSREKSSVEVVNNAFNLLRTQMSLGESVRLCDDLISDLYWTNLLVVCEYATLHVAPSIPPAFTSISGTVSLVFLGLMIAFACTNRFMRGVIGILIIPFTLIWFLFFSYDLRNLNMVIPLVAISTGIGMQWLVVRVVLFSSKHFERNDTSMFVKTSPDLRGNAFLGDGVSDYMGNNAVPSLINRLASIRVVHFLVLTVFLVLLLPFQYTDARLISTAIRRQKLIGVSSWNKKIYDYKEQNGLNGGILTDYQYLGFLPELREYYIMGYSGLPDDFIEKLKQPDVGYVFVVDAWSDPQVDAYIEHFVESGSMTVLFEDSGARFITTCRGDCGK